MKIVGSRYFRANEWLSLSIKQHWTSAEQFRLAVNIDDYMPDVQLSKSLLDSWLCGRRKISSSSAALVWKVASVLCMHSGQREEDAVYLQMSGLLHGRCIVEYESL